MSPMLDGSALLLNENVCFLRKIPLELIQLSKFGTSATTLDRNVPCGMKGNLAR